MASRREDLEKLRDRLWAEMGEMVLGRDAATISREIRAVWDELEALPAEEATAPADQIAQKREARRLRAAGQ